MGARKKIKADKYKEDKKQIAFARLCNCPTSPRKMRLIADMVRGMEATKALDVLRFSPQAASNYMEKLLLSAIANWQVKNEGARMEDNGLFIKEVYVDSARVLKRLRPAPQGRAHRIRKRSNHVTLTLGSSSIEDNNTKA
ncbi:MAG: 50S ribosomal protein L22 [Marinifilaceae bacterium]|jgi:large subunit ribosomal protein L22|nr:50S ribosomal protein L22 [Marinilabiliaceae bacterium JC040]MCT4600679.1 50S ribosomal protein L22 [Marinifilaceae bacterium]